MRGGSVRVLPDRLATEEPMEIRVSAGGERRTLAVTMRTPGADFELAAGFLFSEGVVTRREDIRRIRYCVDRDVEPDQRYNVVTVDLAGAALPVLGSLDRHFVTTSACGVCGKSSLAALQVRARSPSGGQSVSAEILYRLPGELRRAQGIFASTGGLHACGLFSTEGALVAAREDVGRHNAVDKLLGWALLEDRVPLGAHLLMVSGRSSYEILQKAVTAGVPIVCAVSAPSSLAVEVARAFGVTLIGFLRDGRFNVYAGGERVVLPPG
ncbi:MAG TPA: formate dehydrogenase accessory sulfurtransferase FdhD [Acidimicrobiales bacterium]|nr:formate dehydrogenase accessory sulfurtransferase FdhD [Acidimicrobiales bacterium]